MGIRKERMVVLAKIEATSGTDAVPTAATNAVLLQSVTIDVAQGDRIPRQVIRAGMGQVAKFLIGRRVTLTATVELAGAGAAGTAPAWGPLMRMCALAETISAGVKVDYTRIDTGFESGSIYFNLEGNRTAMVGTRGSVKLAGQKGKIPTLAFSLTGIWTGDSAVAYPTPTLTAWKTPVPITKANTPTFTIDGTPVIASSFELDTGVSTAYRELINLQEINVQDVLPAFISTFEEPATGTKNFFALMGGAAVALDLVHGTQAGNIIEISSANLQVQDCKRGDDQGVAMLNLTAEFLIGSPDYTVSVK